MPKIVPLPRRKFEKFLQFVGCHYKRTKGDHVIYDRSDLKRPIVFTIDKEIPPFIIRSNLKTLGLTDDQFLEILSRL